MTDITETSAFAELAAPGTLVMQRWLPGPVDRVWAYLTDGELRRKWLAAGDMKLEKGAPLELVWHNDELCQPGDQRPEGFPDEQRMQSRILAVEPMRLLTLAWGGGDVSFTLTPKGERVLLTITHRGLDERAARLMIGAGWHAHLDILRSRLAGEGAVSFWSHWLKLKAAYDARWAEAGAAGRPRTA